MTMLREARSYEDACGDGRADCDQDQATEDLTVLAGLVPDPGAESEAGLGHGDADGADDDV